MNEFEEYLKKRFEKKEIKTEKDYENELREIEQEIILFGLYKTDLYNNAIFIGGTALRFIHGLDRYSDDLDFNFLKENKDFNWEKYYENIINNGEKYGCNFIIKNLTERKKEAEENNESGKEKRIINRIEVRDEGLGIKIKNMDIVPVEWTKKKAGNYKKTKIVLEASYQYGLIKFIKTERNFLDKYFLNVLNINTLFGGKINAMLTRKDRQGNDIDEGRDWFDFNWLINKRVEPNFEYLYEKIEKNRNFKNKNVVRSEEWVKTELYERAKKLNYEKINQDIYEKTTENNYIELNLEKVKEIINNLGRGGYLIKNNNFN